MLDEVSSHFDPWGHLKSNVHTLHHLHHLLHSFLVLPLQRLPPQQLQVYNSLQEFELHHVEHHGGGGGAAVKLDAGVARIEIGGGGGLGGGLSASGRQPIITVCTVV